MITSTSPDWLHHLLSFALASLIGTSSYLLFWAIQKKLRSPWPLIGLTILTIIVLVHWEIPASVALAGPAFLTCFFRWCADENPAELAKGFCVLLLATTTSIMTTEWLTAALWGYRVYVEGSFIVAFLAPSLTPLLMKAWKDLTLRPGVDRLFEE